MTRGRRPHPDLLTPREQEVLSLIAEGLTNPQIAERLGITERGARYHVSEILTKLNVSSREEAALWAESGSEEPWWRKLSLALAAPMQQAGHLFRAEIAGRLLLGGAFIGLALFAIGIWMMDDRTENSPRRAEVFPTSTPPLLEVTPQNDSLLGPNRDRLRICIQAVELPSLDMVNALQRVEEGMQQAATHPRWYEYGYAQAGGPLVGVGCPREPAALLFGADTQGKGMGHFITAPEPVSPYRLHVYILSKERLSLEFGGSTEHRRLPQEIFFEGHQGGTITTGIYLTEEELERKDFVVEWLLKGLDLHPPNHGTPDIFQTPGNPNSPKPNVLVQPSVTPTAPSSQSGCPVGNNVCSRVADIEKALLLEGNFDWFVQNYQPPTSITCNDPTGYFGPARPELCEGATSSESRPVYSIEPDGGLMSAATYAEALHDWINAPHAVTGDAFGPPETRAYTLGCPTTPGKPDCVTEFILVFSKLPEASDERAFLILGISLGQPPTVSTRLGSLPDPAMMEPTLNGGPFYGFLGPAGRLTNFYSLQ